MACLKLTLTFLSAQGLDQVSGKGEQGYHNPFILSDNLDVNSIGRILLSSSEAGYASAPKRNSLYVELLTENNEPAYLEDPSSLRVTLNKNNQKIQIPTWFQLEKKLYHGELKIPPLENAGWYDLQVQIAGREDLQATKRKALFFLQEKFNLIFLIDNSTSMLANDPSKRRFWAINSIIKNPDLRDKIDKISVITFANKANVIVSPTKLEEIVKDGSESWLSSWISKTRARGNTNFADGILSVSGLIQEGSKEKNIIIFLTDGITNYPYKDEHKNLLRKNAVVFTIGFKANDLDFNTKLLRKIAGETGGIYQDADQSLVETIYRKVINRTLETSKYLQFFPIKNSYFQNELITLNYQTTLKDIRYQVKVNGQVNQNLITWDENSFSLLPLLVGEHDLDITFYSQRKKVFQLFKNISVQNKKSPLETTFPLLLEYSKRRLEQIITFPIWSPESFSFVLPVIADPTKDSLSEMKEVFSFLEAPFSLTPNSERRLNLEITRPLPLQLPLATQLTKGTKANKEAEQGARGEGGEATENFLLFLQTTRGIYAYEINFIPRDENQRLLIKEPQTGGGNGYDSYFKALLGISLAFVLVVVVLTIIYLINKKGKAKKRLK